MDEQRNRSRNIRIQGVGAKISADNQKVLMLLCKKLHQIDSMNAELKRSIEAALKEALHCIDEVYDFVGTPEHILGSKHTKHGEIAEHADVAFQNAWNVLMGKEKEASFDNVGRTAPEDYVVAGVKVQSKYINGTSNSLSHVLNHLEKYKDINFGRDGSYYVIPKDQYKEIQRVLNGDTENLSAKTVNAIKDKVKQIENETGHSFFDVVKSGNVDYAEVQQGAIHKTLHKETKKLQENAAEQEFAVDAESEKQKKIAQENAKPSWKKAAASAGISAGISGGFELSFGIYCKCKQGKKIREFTVKDWQELGIDTAKASIEGGISGLALYGLTNYLKAPAPIAAAGMTLAFSLVDLIYEYASHKISKADFKRMCQILLLNTAICIVGASLGEKLIPIPVLGSMIGSAITNNIFNEVLGKGAHEALLHATEHVHGATVSMLEATMKFSKNHQIVMHNIAENREDCEIIEKNIKDFMEKMEALL